MSVGFEPTRTYADISRALFQRALAELRYLGLLRPTKKKTDHVAKVMWKGL